MRYRKSKGRALAAAASLFALLFTAPAFHAQTVVGRAKIGGYSEDIAFVTSGALKDNIVMLDGFAAYAAPASKKNKVKEPLVRLFDLKFPEFNVFPNGIAYVTEDRKGQGLFLKMTLRDNCVGPSLAAFTQRLGLVREGAVSEFAGMCWQRFRIVTPDVRQQVRDLSGGNQQKALLSMWLGIRPAVLIVDEPTRGWTSAPAARSTSSSARRRTGGSRSC